MSDYPSTSRPDREEARRVLDAELDRLPEKYRAPLVLCYLDGKTNEQAAHELGWPIGSMSKRLARGRELLRERLAHRGTLLSTGLLVTLLTENTSSAAVPTALAKGTSGTIRLLAAGQATITSVTSPSVAALTRGVLGVMGFVKMRFVMGWALTACLTAGIGGASLFHVFVREAVGQNAAPADPRPTAESSTALKLPPALEQIVRIVKPRTDETKWRRIPWLTDLTQAQQVAKKEHRPLFLFVSGDDPLEAC